MSGCITTGLGTNMWKSLWGAALFCLSPNLTGKKWLRIPNILIFSITRVSLMDCVDPQNNSAASKSSQGPWGHWPWRNEVCTGGLKVLLRQALHQEPPDMTSLAKDYALGAISWDISRNKRSNPGEPISRIHLGGMPTRTSWICINQRA